MKISGPHKSSLSDLSHKNVVTYKVTSENPASIATLRKMSRDDVIEEYFKLHDVSISSKHAKRNVEYELHPD
eukprot:CAMPEP_0116873834 /NCGR_PEP_ID=MMETSP0463-20121206/5144_1 /TAXON_ID=181622 /ORGANISM="Strombidinopsis sp, Strain SopsisLIS2011" /LENGTH=71 /DNA_ID=CAMNT_0004516571 /DNA_START=68 /DNA_END=283 /DNA_ORIENTATION=+